MKMGLFNNNGVSVLPFVCKEFEFPQGGRNSLGSMLGCSGCGVGRQNGSRYECHVGSLQTKPKPFVFKKPTAVYTIQLYLYARYQLISNSVLLLHGGGQCISRQVYPT